MTASGPVAKAGAWELLDPYAARIDDLDRADVIVVVGDADVADRGGVLDLRIRKARRRGAHLMIVGPGGSLLERDAGSHPARPAGATTAQALAELVRDPGPLAAAEHPVLIVTDGVDVAAIAAAAHALGLHERGGVLPLPTGANERGARLSAWPAAATRCWPRSRRAPCRRWCCSASTRRPSGRRPTAGRWRCPRCDTCWRSRRS